MEKEEFINEMKKYLEEKKNQISTILTTLNWDEETLLKNKTEMVQCQYNSNHILSKKSINKHYEKCAWTSNGYLDKEQLLPSPTHLGKDTVKIDEIILNDIFKNSSNQKDNRQIPKTYNRLLVDFTPEERLKLYNYTLENTKFEMPQEIPLDNNKINEESGEPSFLELKAMERDSKRRRISYKNKNVHTKNKSQVEIFRDVIKNQMDEWIHSQNKSSILLSENIEKTDQNSLKDFKYLEKNEKNHRNIEDHLDVKNKFSEKLNHKKKNMEYFQKKHNYHYESSCSKNEYHFYEDSKYNSKSPYSYKKKYYSNSSSSEDDIKRKPSQKHKKHSKHKHKRKRSTSSSNDEYHKTKRKHKKENKSKKKKHSHN